jgi:hypothetical protein
MCLGEYIEFPEGRHCEFCYPHMNIAGLIVCVDMIYKLLKELEFCQQCHIFTWKREVDELHYHGKVHIHHLKIKKPRSLIALARIKYPQLANIWSNN